jgi:hypothetical protein
VLLGLHALSSGDLSLMVRFDISCALFLHKYLKTAYIEEKCAHARNMCRCRMIAVCGGDVWFWGKCPYIMFSRGDDQTALASTEQIYA